MFTNITKWVRAAFAAVFGRKRRKRVAPLVFDGPAEPGERG
jgi:hypothetical protein